MRAFLIAVCLVWPSVAAAEEPVPMKRLAVTSAPAGVSTRVNGRFVGKTPVVMEIPAEGMVHVELEAGTEPIVEIVQAPSGGEMTLHAVIGDRKVTSQSWIDARLILLLEEGGSKYSRETLESGMVRVTALANDGDYSGAELVCKTIDTNDPTLEYCVGTVAALRYVDERSFEIGYAACGALESYLHRAPNGFFAKEAKATMSDMGRAGMTCSRKEKMREARAKLKNNRTPKKQHPRKKWTKRQKRERAEMYVDTAKRLQTKGKSDRALRYLEAAIQYDNTYGEAYCIHTIYSNASPKPAYVKKCLKLAPKHSANRELVKMMSNPM